MSTPPASSAPSPAPLKRTPFYDFHLSTGARMVGFAGYELPVMYRSIAEEHRQCRTSGALFDVSHMGRLSFTGKDALPLLEKVLTRRLSDMVAGQCRYSLVCNEQGGVMDDIIVSRDVKQWTMVCNAANREKVHRHLVAVRSRFDFDCDLSDQTESTAMVAIQGPKVMERLAGILPSDVADLKRFRFQTVSLMLFKLTVYRTGYTGEDGVEIVLPAKAAGMAMRMLAGSLSKESATIMPAGLGARDTLRTEAALPLYGHELTEAVDPISAGLQWAVSLDKDFIGAEALRAIAAAGPKRKLVGLELTGTRIARQGTPVRLAGREDSLVGEVTSGTLSPTLGTSIAMAYVDAAHSAEGTALAADLRGDLIAARVVRLPFYKRPG